MSAGNDDTNKNLQALAPIIALPETLVSAIPNLILVGAANKQSRAALFPGAGPDMIWAPGQQVRVAGPPDGGQNLVDRSGSSYAAPLVAGLVAYYRGLRYRVG